MKIKLIIFLFIYFPFIKGNCNEKLILDLEKGFTKNEIHQFENSIISCHQNECFFKDKKNKITLEFNKNEKLKNVKLNFYKFKNEKKNIEKMWLKDDKMIIEKNLKYFDKGKVNIKKIRLFFNKNNYERSKFSASISLNNEAFSLTFYSLSEGEELLKYLQNYKLPLWKELLLVYLKKFLAFFN